ncbi:site-specific integrase [Vreelandella gomseomensis]|uniref:Site-specific integrase n=1 Tax=Vreelandella gomseomensis TaxID=370766 RepID=A0ABU1GEV2_9GAMM|nr:site-specific integrase [Halomonas gomseomensis]MDR5876013.1 site-specific integrase [Halomonas gomseomensis]
MPVQKLTDAGVLTLHCPEGRSHSEVFDTLMRGLYVDVMANGRLAYRVRYRLHGKQRVFTLGDARLLTVEEARAAARTTLRRVLIGDDPRSEVLPEQGPTLAAFFLEQYLPYVKSYKRSWSTDETMLRQHLIPAFGERAMGSVIPPDVARLVETMRGRGYAAGTCNRALVLLRYGYTLALRWNIEGVEQNPAKELKGLKEDNRIERFLTPDQTQHLLVAVRKSQNPLLASIVAFLIYTGARKREVLDARWSDIDVSRKLWRIPKTKSGKVRHVPLSMGALQLLAALRAEHPPLDGLVFANPCTGRPFVSIFHSWDTARQRAGLPELRLHDLRHSFASFLVNAGRSLYEVQELLGHADIRTTSRYAHLSRERLFEAVEAVPLIKG